MKCPNCGSEMKQFPDIALWECTNDKCKMEGDYDYFVADEIALEWQARAEKAEGELKAIKARIEAVITDKDDMLYYILDDCYCDNNMNGIADRRIKELIKQIGGEK